MTFLDLATLERIALEHASAESPLREALRVKIETNGPLAVGQVGPVHTSLYGKYGQRRGEESKFLVALIDHVCAATPDRRRRSRRSTDLDTERKSVELMTALGESIGQIFGQLAGESYTEALNRKIAAHEPRAGEGRTDD